MEPEDPRFFRSGAEFRRWLARNHAKVPVLWLGYWKKSAGRKGITYAEAVDEALCYGWIDGHVKGRDEHSWVQRFTPRRPGSTWSAINLAKVARLEAAGRMAKPGLDAHRNRDPRKVRQYSFENRDVKFSPEIEKRFRAKVKAWKFWAAQPPGYRRLMMFWVMRAKKEETRARRLDRLVEASASGERL